MSVPEEIDFEVDAADLTYATINKDLGAPSLVVDDLYITYKVWGGKKIGSGSAKQRRVLRALNRSREHVGAITQVEAVRGISFVARHGESIGIVGVNGSGKSTLLRAIAGLHPPTAGSVYVSGEPSLLGVNAVLMGSLTGERNIMIGGLALGLTPAQVRDRFDEIVDYSGIGDAIYMPMDAYSSGMGARLRFAISSAAVPDVLMIDEALATGDAAFRNKSKARIDEIRNNAGTVFLVSHSLATVEAMCQRTLWIHQGKLVMDGPSPDVCEAYRAFIKASDKR
jgi:teichoic acid transport system ATP-binding protein